MRLLLMLLISQAIYDAADLGRQPGDAPAWMLKKCSPKTMRRKDASRGGIRSRTDPNNYSASCIKFNFVDPMGNCFVMIKQIPFFFFVVQRVQLCGRPG